MNEVQVTNWPYIPQKSDDERRADAVQTFALMRLATLEHEINDADVDAAYALGRRILDARDRIILKALWQKAAP